MTRPRAADDFSAIRARMEELRRERAGAQAAESDSRDPPMHRDRSERWHSLRDQRRDGTGPPIRPDTQLGREEVCWSRREQAADQLGALVEARLLGGTHLRVRECGFDLL